MWLCTGASCCYWDEPFQRSLSKVCSCWGERLLIHPPLRYLTSLVTLSPECITPERTAIWSIKKSLRRVWLSTMQIMVYISCESPSRRQNADDRLNLTLRDSGLHCLRSSCYFCPHIHHCLQVRRFPDWVSVTSLITDTISFDLDLLSLHIVLHYLYLLSESCPSGGGV